MPDNPSILIRPMLSGDLKAAMALALAEGWNQTEKDWRLLLDNKLNTCLVAESNQKVIGTATAINYSNLEGWIGMVLVDKEYRRQGIGRKLVARVLKKLDGFRSIKLDATPAGQPLYQSLGFIEERVLNRMTNASFKEIKMETINLSPQPVLQTDIGEVVKFDSKIFGVDRSYLIKTIHQNNPNKAFLLRQNGILSGYILGRVGTRFNYIGPVFAFTTAEAKVLIAKTLEFLSNQPVALDIHDDKQELIVWLESIGFIRQRQFARMYLKHNPYPGKVGNQYLIIGPEYG